MIVAELTGEARHHAKWRPLTRDEETAAITGLRAIAGSRADLLAEVAGSWWAHQREGWTSRSPGRPQNYAARPEPTRTRSNAGSGKGGAGPAAPAPGRTADGLPDNARRCRHRSQAAPRVWRRLARSPVAGFSSSRDSLATLCQASATART